MNIIRSTHVLHELFFPPFSLPFSIFPHFSIILFFLVILDSLFFFYDRYCHAPPPFAIRSGFDPEADLEILFSIIDRIAHRSSRSPSGHFFGHFIAIFSAKLDLKCGFFSTLSHFCPLVKFGAISRSGNIIPFSPKTRSYLDAVPPGPF